EWVIVSSKLWSEAALRELPAKEAHSPLHVVAIPTAGGDPPDSRPSAKSGRPSMREPCEDRSPTPLGSPGLCVFLERSIVAIVPTEYFVTSITRQGDRDLSSGKLAHEKCWQR